MCNLWAGSGSRLLVLGLQRKDQRCQFGFGGGSRPLVFFRRCLLMEQLDLGLQAGLVQTRRVPVSVWVARVWLERSAPRFGVPYSKGDLTCYSPAACRAYRAAHSCLWDWELCRPPEGFAELPRLPASARSPCSTAPGSLSLEFRVQLLFVNWGIKGPHVRVRLYYRPRRKSCNPTRFNQLRQSKGFGSKCPRLTTLSCESEACQMRSRSLKVEHDFLLGT